VNPMTTVRRLIVMTASAWLLMGSSQAQNSMASPPHSASSSSNEARYEIVQSQLAARWTFRLDRMCGSVSQLVRTADDENTWEPMVVAGLGVCKTERAPRFQIFSSSLAARHTFLIDTSTGKTWTLTTYTDEEGRESTGWAPFSD
jgi:acetyl-CoA acetyltransferase